MNRLEQMRDLCDKGIKDICFTAMFNPVEIKALLDVVSCLDHAIELGYLGEGSTRGWAIDVLKPFTEEVGDVE